MNNEKLVEENLGLVHACCKRFKNRGIEYEELYSAGCLGLVKAAVRFRPELGVRLSTYAVPVILGEIKRLFRDGGTVRVSRSLKELSLRLNRFAESFSSQNGRAPTVGELAELSGESRERVAEALNAARQPLSLSSDDEDDRPPEPYTEDTTELLCDKLALREVIRSLDIGDRKIIELRYFKRKTQQKTAEALGMTQVQISRREKKILLKMRERLAL